MSTTNDYFSCFLHNAYFNNSEIFPCRITSQHLIRNGNSECKKKMWSNGCLPQTGLLKFDLYISNTKQNKTI